MVSARLGKDSIAEFLLRTSGSKKLFDRAKRSLPSGTTRSPYFYSPYPLYIRKGEGPYIWDVDDNKYLDFANNMGPLILGHRHPAVEKAVREQVGAFWSGGPTEHELKLAEEVKRAFPMADKVLFTPSGSEATMKLIRAARAASGKDRIMLSTGAYHGSHDVVTNGPGIPKSYLSLVTRYPYNDEDAFVTEFKKVKDETAAVLVEGLLGKAGSVPPSRKFIKTVREETERAGVALIMDEVVTGFRVKRGGMSEMMGIKPDGVALGKVIGGGFPVGAFLGTDALMREYEYADAKFPMVGKAPLGHAGTFNAHPVAMAAGLATLEALTPQAYEHLDGLGREARRTLDEIATEHKVPHAMTGISSVFLMHFSKAEIYNEETSHDSDERKGRLFDELMLTHGVSMPAFHTAFASLPMGRKEMVLFEGAARLSFDDMKKMHEV